MKTTEGFVYAREDGEYVIVHESTTHTGHHYNISYTHDIESATVYFSHYLPMTERSKFNSLRKIPVKVTRTVEIRGWGM